MKPIYKNTLLTLSGAILGGLVVFALLSAKPSLSVADSSAEDRPLSPTLELFAKDALDPFGSDDIFANMREMQKRMFDNMASFSGPVGIDDIKSHEDADFVYYELVVPDLKSTNLETNVEDGYLSIFGTVQKSNDEDEVQGFLKSKFYRKFPLPRDVDYTKMQISNENNKVVLKFPKLKA